MNNIDKTSHTRENFFPTTKKKQVSNKSISDVTPWPQNNEKRKDEIEKIPNTDSKVQIPEAVREFSKIKRAVDLAPPVDNSAKISDIKKRIADGTYKVDYEGLADKILASEF